MKKDKMLHIYLGSYVRNYENHDEHAISYSSNNLQERIIESIHNERSISLLLCPIRKFSRGGPLIFIGDKDKDYKNEFYIPFLNFQPFKLITVNLIFSMILLFFYVNKLGKIKLISFNSSIYFTIPLLLSKALGIFDIIILADLPNKQRIIFKDFYKENTWFPLARLANRIITFNKNNLYIVNGCDKRFLEIDFPPNKNRFLADNKFQYKVNNTHKTFSYSGSIGYRYSIDKLIKLFREMGNNYRLNLYGYVEDTDILLELANCNNVDYLGNIPNKELLETLVKSSDFLVVNYDDEFISMRYPNRIIEYMLTGVPIIVNYVESFPDWIKQFLNFVDFEDYSGFYKSISFFSLDANYSKLLKLAAEAKLILTSNDFNDNIDDRIYRFMFEEES